MGSLGGSIHPDLSKYLTNVEFEEFTASFTDIVSNDLVTNDSLASTLASYATIAGLSNYVTEAELTTTLGDYL